MEIEQLQMDCLSLTRKIGDIKKKLNFEVDFIPTNLRLNGDLKYSEATLTEKKNKVKKLTEELNDIC